MGANFLNLVVTKVTISGEEQKFISLQLHQRFNHHHSFTVIVNYLSPNNTFQQKPETFIKYIGETAHITFSHVQSGDSYEFSGIVTRVELVGSEGEAGGIAIHGSSPTILYENNKTLDSWMDKNLSAIIEDATKEYKKVPLVSKPQYGKEIPYMAQYNENVFDFMNRLSALYGEWFYYDGSHVYFGNPQISKTEKIVYDVDLEEVRLVASLIPGKSAKYDYVAQENKTHNADTPEKPENLNEFQAIAYDCSEQSYSATPNLAANPHISDKEGLEMQIKVFKNASASRLITIVGRGKTCRTRIGEIIDVSFPAAMNLPPLGKFRITEITHEVARDGHYINTFTGIPEKMNYIPVDNTGTPVAMPELATVDDNADPKNQGRVKVCFEWQKKKKKTTNWIRVQSPNAGVSGSVPKNRGLVFVPEKDDQVMVSYEHGNPDRPYVAGGMFHSESGKGGDKDNKSKSIMTRSGISILFDDEKGSIIIADQTGKDMILIDGTDSITVLATKRITLTNEKESSIIMEDNKIGIQAEFVNIEGTQQLTLMSKDENVVLTSGKGLSSTTKTTKITANDTYELQTKKGTINGSEVTIEGSANVTVSGGLVKINS